VVQIKRPVQKEDLVQMKGLVCIEKTGANWRAGGIWKASATQI